MADPRSRIIVLDDDRAVVEFIVELLRDRYEVEGTVSARAALERTLGTDIDLVISDVEMTEMSGIDLLSAIHARKPDQLVVLITAFSSTEMAVQMVRMGACDFITKPFKAATFVAAIDRALAERRIRREVVRVRPAPVPDRRLIARSAAMRTVFGLAHRAAMAESPVLICGEQGVGKAAIARWIHDKSPRHARPFLQVSCASAPSELAETLFGDHRRSEPRAGLFAEAAGGTVFLDDVSELSSDAQLQLVRVLEAARGREPGAVTDAPADVRVIGGTRKALAPLISAGKFRAELLHRIGVVQIDVPPLRDRREDIPELVHALLQGVRGPTVPKGITEAALLWLAEQAWPGNVRELENTLERAVVLADHDALVLEDFAGQPRGSQDNTIHEQFVWAADCRLSLAEIESAYIKRVIDSVAGNISHAARILGIDRRTLHRKLEGA